jgi:hypothetical protein
MWEIVRKKRSDSNFVAMFLDLYIWHDEIKRFWQSHSKKRNNNESQKTSLWQEELTFRLGRDKSKHLATFHKPHYHQKTRDTSADDAISPVDIVV